MYFKVTTEAEFLLTYQKLANVNSNLVSDQFHIPMLSSLSHIYFWVKKHSISGQMDYS